MARLRAGPVADDDIAVRAHASVAVDTRTLDDHLAAARTSADDAGSPVSLLIVDIDGLAAPGADREGGEIEHALTIVESALRSTLKGRDTVVRCGCNRYALLLPATALDGAVRVGRAVCRQIEALRIGGDGHAGLAQRLTASIGAAETVRDEAAETLLERADEACGLARRLGGNRVVSESHLGDHELALIC